MVSLARTDQRNLHLSTNGSAFDTLCGVYTGNAVSDLTEVVGNDNEHNGVNTSRVQFVVTPGVLYYIAIDGFSRVSGTTRLSWNFQGAPANDAFEEARPLSGTSGTDSGTNAFATKEADEPNHAGIVGGASVWYSWVSPADGTVTFDTQGSDFDTLASAYIGDALADLTAIAGNDDTVGRTSSITFETSAGMIYHIGIDGYYGATGSIALNWQFENGSFNLMRSTYPHEVFSGSLRTTNPDAVRRAVLTSLLGRLGGAAVDEVVCDEPAEPNKGNVGVPNGFDERGGVVLLSTQTVYLGLPANPGSNPNVENTCPQSVPVTHQIVTINTPRHRDLPGKLRLTLKSGDASAIEIKYNGAAYTLGSDISVTEPNHDGCTEHTWHYGTEIFEFTGKKKGVVVLEAQVDPDPEEEGNGEPDKKLTITINIFKIAFKPKPASGTGTGLPISAKTDWPAQEDNTRKAQIVVETDPSQYASQLTLVLDQFDPDVNADYQPPTLGTLSGTSATWEYEAFVEPKTEKNPKEKKIMIKAMLGEQILCPVHKVLVAPVFDWLSKLVHKHGYDGTEHRLPHSSDRIPDRNQAGKYVVWKYMVPTASISWSYALSGKYSDVAEGWTDISKPKGSRPVKIYPSAFDGSENWCASTIGHENVHGGEDSGFLVSHFVLIRSKYWKQFEYPAYQWEVDNADQNGLSSFELDIVRRKRDQAKQGQDPTGD